MSVKDVTDLFYMIPVVMSRPFLEEGDVHLVIILRHNQSVRTEEKRLRKIVLFPAGGGNANLGGNGVHTAQIQLGKDGRDIKTYKVDFTAGLLPDRPPQINLEARRALRGTRRSGAAS